MSKKDFVGNDTMKSTKKRSKRKIENDTTAKSWTRNCPKCQKIVTHKSRGSRDNSIRYNRWCHSCRNHGKNNPFYGKKHTKEHREYISTIAPSSRPEVREKISLANKGKIMSESTKQKLREATLEQFSTPESRIENSKRIKAAHERDPSLREKARLKALEQYKRYRESEEYKKWAARKTEYELYKHEVNRLTYENDLRTLDNWSKRNLYHKYELDHIYPIRNAFKQGIPAELIGDIRNLRVIPRKENRSKSGKVTLIPEHIQNYLVEVTDERNT